MNFNSLKKECFEKNLKLQDKGIKAYVSIADRAEGVFTLVPSPSMLGSLKSRDMLILNFNGSLIEGEGLTTDATAHALLYQNINGINSVCFSTQDYTLGWACARRAIPQYSLTYWADYPYEVPISEPLIIETQKRNSYGNQIGNAILNLFAETEIVISPISIGNITTDSAYIRAESALNPLTIDRVLVACWGGYAWASNADKAIEKVMQLERMAKTAFIAEKLNPNIDCLNF